MADKLQMDLPIQACYRSRVVEVQEEGTTSLEALYNLVKDYVVFWEPQIVTGDGLFIGIIKHEGGWSPQFEDKFGLDIGYLDETVYAVFLYFDQSSDAWKPEFKFAGDITEWQEAETREHDRVMARLSSITTKCKEFQ